MTIELDANLKANLSRYLPADLLKQLPESGAMRESISRLSSLYTSVSSFLPTYIVENEKNLDRDYGDMRPGTFMFADVSGFTALSELLQAKGGSEGVEIMTQIINDYFAKMLEIIAKSDGQLLKFAGDALLAFFPQRVNERMDEAEKAIRTGLRMQRSMQEFFQPIQNPLLNELFGEHDLELTMSIGISQGNLFEALIGNTSQRDHIIQGVLPGMAESAEEAGIRDDVIIDQHLYDKFKDDFTCKEMEPGFYVVVDDLGDDLGDFEFHIPRRRRSSSGSLFAMLDSNPVDELKEELKRVQNVGRFVAPEVVNRLAVTAEHVKSENRPSTVIFSHVSGFSKMLEQWGDDDVQTIVSILSRYYTIMHRIIVSYGGVLTRTDPYKSGFKMLITFGAPVAHPDDPERAVRTALEIRKQLGEFNERLLSELPEKLHMKPFIEQRFGVTHGQVFAGEAGWRARREYTVMGDDVNLAARLMGKSSFGKIFVSTRVYSRTLDLFDYEVLEPMALKGKSNIIQAYSVKQSRHTTSEVPMTSDTPFIGREILMLSLTSMLKRAVQDHTAGSVALIADAGTGKTRTATQLTNSAEILNMKTAWSSCQIHDDRRFTWANIIAQLLELDSESNKDKRFEIFDKFIKQHDLGHIRTALYDLMIEYFGGVQGSGPKKSKTDTQSQPAVEKHDDNDIKPERNIFEIQGVDPNEEERFATSPTPPTGLFKILQTQTTEKSEASNKNSTSEIWRDIALKTSTDQAVVDFFRVYTQEHPTMIVLDDFHDMNALTKNIVAKLVREVNESPLVVLTTAEPGHDIPSNLPQMEVSDLAEEETTLMALKILKANELGENLEHYLWEGSNGRPFYVESLIQSLMINGQVKIQQGFAELREDVDVNALPDGIRELIISRVDQLSPEMQEILRTAAVLDTPFTKQTMIDLLERDVEENVSGELSQLMMLQLLEKNSDGEYEFRHGVAQKTMYETLSRFQRQKVHGKIANYFEGKMDGSDRVLLVVAHHLLKAGRMMRAIEIISTAAQQAEDAKDLERAIELYTRAKEILPSDDQISSHLERLINIQQNLGKGDE